MSPHLSIAYSLAPAASPTQVQETVFASLDNHVLERIAKIMSYVKTAGGRKLKRREKEELLGLTSAGAGGAGGVRAAGGLGDQGRAAAGAVPAGSGAAARPVAGAVPAAADDDDDIFEEAGTDYKPTIKKKGDRWVVAWEVGLCCRLHRRLHS